MLDERATDGGFEYVDLYHAFNGADGRRPLGDLTVDAAHPLMVDACNRTSSRSFGSRP